MTKISKPILLFLSAGLLIALPAAAQERASAPEGDAPDVSAESVQQTIALDGRTLRIGSNLVRVWGIAAPALTATGGPQAREVMASLLQTGQVDCNGIQRSGEVIIATCRLNDSLDLGEELVAQGAAVNNGAVTAGTQLGERYNQRQAAARQAGLGVWGAYTGATNDPLRDILGPYSQAIVTLAAALLGVLIGYVAAAGAAKRAFKRGG